MILVTSTYSTSCLYEDSLVWAPGPISPQLWQSVRGHSGSEFSPPDRTWSNSSHLSSSWPIINFSGLRSYLAAFLPWNINVDLNGVIFTTLYWQVDTLFLIYHLWNLSTFSPSRGKGKKLNNDNLTSNSM